MTQIVTHPQVLKPESCPIVLNCLAVHQTLDLNQQVDVEVPIALADNLAALSRLVSKALNGDWVVISAF